MDKRQEIINAARTVFAREGYKGATIGRIAEEANLKSPSLVYWYFKDKRELFQAIIDEISPVLNQLPTFWKSIDEPPEELLPFVLRTFLSTLDSPEAMQIFGIVLAEIQREFELVTGTAEKILPVLNFIISYLDRQVELGRLRPHNTQASARLFIGSFLIYVLNRELFLPLRAGLPDREEYAREIVSIFIHGLKTM
ncbi:MAG: TetR/AcrR family transcriptional regulator [Dehalococcoidales bacterium]|nr:TetR/AcrR family transcriptional regulator [Dehalococcoidales bacterium]